MSPSLFVRIKSLFARDKYSYWFNEFTDDEKKLACMDVWQLAGVIQESIECNNNVQKRIVAEHLLSVRLAKIQAKPVYLSVFTGLIGIVVGVLLTHVLQTPNEEKKCVCEYSLNGHKQMDNSIPVKRAPLISKSLNVPKNERVQDESQSGAKSNP